MPDFFASPMTDLTPKDEASSPGGLGGLLEAAVPSAPTSKNYANSEKVVDFVQQELQQLLTMTRSQRFELDAEWNAIRRMLYMQHDDGQRYRGRSNSYLPVYARNRETLVSNLSRGLFPSDEYMDVQDRSGTGGKGKAQSVKAVLQYQFERSAQLKRMLKPFLGQLIDLGTSVLKFSYRKPSKPALQTGRVNRFVEGLQVSTRSMHYVHVYPLTADTLEDAQVIFEDIDMPLSYVQAMKDQGLWENTESVLLGDSDITEQHSSARSELMNVSQTAQDDTLRKFQRTITESWLSMVLPDDAYDQDEEKGTPVPCRVVTAGPHILRVERNPCWHQSSPYLISRMNVTPGLFYGHGYGKKVRPLQYLTNDFANQTNDVGIYGLNPVVKRIPSKMAGPMRPLAPGVVWDVLEHDAVQFDRPPIEQAGMGLQYMNTYLGMAQDFGGAPPILQGSKGGKTATATQALQRNAMGPIQDLVEDIEQDVMLPLMWGCWKLCQQYMPPEVQVRVGGESVQVKKEDLDIDPDFIWLASSQAMNAQQRAQQAMGLMQALPPLMPLIMQNGYKVDPVPLIRRVYTDGFGFRGFDAFISEAAPMDPAAQMAMAGQGQPGLPPEVMEQEGIRSTVEQSNSPPADTSMVPGEGDDFAQVREEADDLSSYLGSTGGGI